MIDKFLFASMLKRSEPVCKEDFIVERCIGKKVLDLGCIRHSAEYAMQDHNWLHRKIMDVASHTVGVDYLSEEIAKLSASGYTVVFGDVTKHLEISEQFDVIVAGDLIEHLTNFEGFFLNCSRLLKDDGVIIITTPNPFFADEYNYISFKGNYLINPEHTCWIDPMCLLQLSTRFNFFINEIFFIKGSWQLKDLIFENKNHVYDIINDRWVNNNYSRILEKYEHRLKKIFNILYRFYKKATRANSPLVRYGNYLAVLKKVKPETGVAYDG